MIGGARENGTAGVGRGFKILIEEEQWQLVGEPQFTPVGKMFSVNIPVILSVVSRDNFS